MSQLPKDLFEMHNVGPLTRERIVSDRQVPAFKEYKLALVGSSEARHGFYFVRQLPDMRQLLICIAGAGEVWIEGAWRELTAGEAYLTPAGVPHAYRAKTKGAWSLCWVIYHAMADKAPRSTRPLPSVLNVNARAFALTIEGLCEAVAHHGVQAESELWTRLVHHHVQTALTPSGSHDPRLATLWSAVDADLAHPWTLAGLAKRAGLSREALRRACLANTGRSPLREVTHRRLRRAADLLRHTPDKIAAIAVRVGFSDPFAFSTAFKRAWGRSPRHHREASSPAPPPHL